LAILKYVTCLIFFANDDVRQKLRHNLLFFYRAKEAVDAQAQDTSSRRHFGLQIVQTSTRSITRYMGPSSAAGLQSENPKSGRVATAHR